jgi:hypothetical protein
MLALDILSVLCKISAGELGEEEANERLGRMGQSGASILPRLQALVLTKEIGIWPVRQLSIDSCD